jgi:hypothetical protein
VWSAIAISTCSKTTTCSKTNCRPDSITNCRPDSITNCRPDSITNCHSNKAEITKALGRQAKEMPQAQKW